MNPFLNSYSPVIEEWGLKQKSYEKLNCTYTCLNLTNVSAVFCGP